MIGLLTFSILLSQTCSIFNINEIIAVIGNLKCVNGFISLTFCLLFRVRQFIEMVNGTDSEVRCLGGHSPKSQDSYPVSPRSFSSPSMSPSHGMNIHNLATGKGSSTHFTGKFVWRIRHTDLDVPCHIEFILFNLRFYTQCCV